MKTSFSKTLDQLVAACAALVVHAVTQSALSAATLTVTSTSDGGPGTLRAALASATHGDTIAFSLPLPATITLTNGELVVSNNVTIAGSGAPDLSLSGSNVNRIFNVASNRTVNISGLTIRDGYAAAGRDGGGILNAGTLTLSNCTVAFNLAGYPAGPGGGVFNLEAMTVVGCTFRSNQAGAGSAGAPGGCGLCKASPDDGSPGGSGGGIYNAGSLTIVSSTFYDNRGGKGGAGGAQYASGSGGSGGYGGFGGAIYNAGSLTSVACTVSGNRAGAGGTGGFASSFPSPGYGGMGGPGGSGGGIVNGGTATVHNSIIALNVGGEGGSGGFGGASGPSGAPGMLPDVLGEFISLGRNLVGASDGSTGLTNGSNGNIVGTTNNPVNPRLGTLQDNGGPTWTMVLLTASPAINAGDDTLTGTDQRGYPRLSGAHVDIGATEGFTPLFSRGEALLVGQGWNNNSIAALEVRSGAAVGTFVQPGAGASYQTKGPRAMLCFNNQLLVVNQNVDTPYNGEILAFDLNTGAFIGKCVPSSNVNAPYAPRGMILGSNSVICVADVGGFDGVHPGRIARYDTAGTYLGNVTTTGLSTPFYPMSLVIGPDGIMYVSGVGNLAQGSRDGYIFRFQFNPGTQNYQYLSTIVSSTAANSYASGLHSPEGIVFGPDGNIYITSFYASFNNSQGATVEDRDAILVFNRNGQRIGSPIHLWAAGEARVFGQSLLFGPRGDLFVPITSGSTVRRYSASSGFQQFTVLPIGGASPQAPWYLTFRATNPRTLAYEAPRVTGAVSGDDFNVSWPSTYVGWQLQTHTNVAVGLTSDWQSVPESLLTNSITVTRTNPFAAFRLLAP